MSFLDSLDDAREEDESPRLSATSVGGKDALRRFLTRREEDAWMLNGSSICGGLQRRANMFFF